MQFLHPCLAPHMTGENGFLDLHLFIVVSTKEIAVAGDILEICEEYYLNMLTIYGILTVINHLNSKSTGDLIECLIENLSKLKSIHRS